MVAQCLLNQWCDYGMVRISNNHEEWNVYKESQKSQWFEFDSRIRNHKIVNVEIFCVMFVSLYGKQINHVITKKIVNDID